MTEQNEIGKIAHKRASELMADKNVEFESFADAYDIALEEIIDECKCLMAQFHINFY